MVLCHYNTIGNYQDIKINNIKLLPVARVTMVTTSATDKLTRQRDGLKSKPQTAVVCKTDQTREFLFLVFYVDVTSSYSSLPAL